jgi:hypothetical protein
MKIFECREFTIDTFFYFHSWLVLRPNRFIWTVEWLFPEVVESLTPRRILEHRNEETKTLLELLTGAISKEENKDLVSKYPMDSLSQCRFYYLIPLRHVKCFDKTFSWRAGSKRLI